MSKIIGIVLFIAVLGLVGHQDQIDEQKQAQADMINTCQHSYQVTDGLLESACSDMIDKVQASGEYEVIQTEGRFAVERKGK